MTAHAGAGGPGAEGPTVDSWSDKDQRIVVSQPAAGFLYDLVLRAKIDAEPSRVYDVLIDPSSHKIFRGIKATLNRTVLEDDGKGRRKLRVGHRALTKFLWISVTFDTELFVWEDDVARTIRFTNARKDGFMSKFDGTWQVQPFTQQTLDSIYKKGAAAATAHPTHHGHNWLSGILHQGSHLGSKAADSQGALVTLNQALAPRAKPPGPVAHLVRGLCGRVLHNMMEDLRTEVERRQQVASGGQQHAAGTTGRPHPFILSPSSSSSTSRQSNTHRSLPVAALTLSSSSSSSGGDARPLFSSDGDKRQDQRTCQQAPWQVATDVLGGVMAAAVPLHLTIKL